MSCFRKIFEKEHKMLSGAFHASTNIKAFYNSNGRDNGNDRYGNTNTQKAISLLPNSTVRTISMLNVEAVRTVAQHLVGIHDL